MSSEYSYQPSNVAWLDVIGQQTLDWSNSTCAQKDVRHTFEFDFECACRVSGVVANDLESIPLPQSSPPDGIIKLSSEFVTPVNGTWTGLRTHEFKFAAEVPARHKLLATVKLWLCEVEYSIWKQADYLIPGETESPNEEVGALHAELGGILVETMFVPLPTPGAIPGDGDSLFSTGDVIARYDSFGGGRPKGALHWQKDHNLVLYEGDNPVLASGTQTDSKRVAVFQDDGNFVIYDNDKDGKTVWKTDTWAPGFDALTIDGHRLYFFSNSEA